MACAMPNRIFYPKIRQIAIFTEKISGLVVLFWGFWSVIFGLRLGGMSMVKIRESLPLLDGTDAGHDSTTMIASITASQRHFTHTDLPILSEPASHIIDQHTIDTDAWLVSMAKRANEPHLADLSTACELLNNHDLSTDSKRSNAFCN